jgi:hypothetical protein
VRPWWQRVHGYFVHTPAPIPTSTLDIKTGPETASVWLDGKQLTSRRIAVPKGSVHQLRVTAPGCDPLNMELRPTRDLEPVHVMLERLPDPAAAAPSAAASAAPNAPAPKAAHRAPSPRTAGATGDDGSPLWRPTGL